MKEKLGKIVGVIFLVVCVVYLLVTGIMDLTNKKDLISLKISDATTILEIEHSINGIIPTGTDYYYIGIEKDTDNAYIIKAPKNWLSKNFSQDYKSLDSAGANINGLIKRVSDYKVRDELESRATTFEGIEMPISASYCVDLQYKTNAIGKLLLLVLSGVIALCIYVVAKRKDELDDRIAKPLLTVLLVVVIVWLFLLLRVLR